MACGFYCPAGESIGYSLYQMAIVDKERVPICHNNHTCYDYACYVGRRRRVCAIRRTGKLARAGEVFIRMKVKIIPPHIGVRCMAFMACGNEDCDHHGPHLSKPACCVPNQVRFCRRLEFFVTDIALTDLDSTLASNPNMAFKAKKDYR